MGERQGPAFQSQKGEPRLRTTGNSSSGFVTWLGCLQGFKMGTAPPPQMTYSLTRFAIYETMRDYMTKDSQGPLPFYSKVLLGGISGEHWVVRARAGPRPRTLEPSDPDISITAGLTGGFVGTPADLVNVRFVCTSHPPRSRAFLFPSRQAFARNTPSLHSTLSLGQATQTPSLGLAKSHDPSLKLGRQSTLEPQAVSCPGARGLMSIQRTIDGRLSYCFRMQNDVKLPLSQRRK